MMASPAAVRAVVIGGQGRRRLAWDDFTHADGTALESHTPASGGTWTAHASFGAGMVIDGNRVHNANDASARCSYHSVTPPTANYDVTADIVCVSDNDLSRIGVAGRIVTGAVTLYYASHNTNGNAWQLFKNVAGASTQLGSNVTQQLTVGQSYRLTLSMREDLIRLIVDGSVLISVSDTAVTAAGKAGIRAQTNATSSTGVHLDNWEVTF